MSTSFRLHGDGSREGNQALVQQLSDEHELFTVRRTGVKRGDWIRGTSALYYTPEDAEWLAGALKTIASTE